MANVRIHDLILAGAIASTMQLETDTSGLTSNKITIAMLEAFFNANLTFAATSHTHALGDINNIAVGNLVGDSDGTGTVGPITLNTDLGLSAGTLSIKLSGGQTF